MTRAVLPIILFKPGSLAPAKPATCAPRLKPRIVEWSSDSLACVAMFVMTLASAAPTDLVLADARKYQGAPDPAVQLTSRTTLPFGECRRFIHMCCLHRNSPTRSISLSFISSIQAFPAQLPPNPWDIAKNSTFLGTSI